MSLKVPLNPHITMMLRSCQTYKADRLLQIWRRQALLLRRAHLGGYVGPLLGDPTCRFNAHSPWIYCAIHPDGPCQGCPDREVLPTCQTLLGRSETQP